MELKPIDTIYDGYKFRSRLEARWAVFFDAMGIKFEYESQGYELPSGKLYLPDFKLHGFHGRESISGSIIDYGCLWCEVKGVDSWDELKRRENETLKKVDEFSGIWSYEIDGKERYVQNPTVFLPNVPRDTQSWWETGVTQFVYIDGDIEWPCVICRPMGDEPGLVLCGPDGDSAPNSRQINVTEYCLSIARQARFEHGQTPRVVKV